MLDLYSAADLPHRRAVALNTVGCYQARLGEYAPAVECCEQALSLHRAQRRTAEADRVERKPAAEQG